MREVETLKLLEDYLVLLRWLCRVALQLYTFFGGRSAAAHFYRAGPVKWLRRDCRLIVIFGIESRVEAEDGRVDIDVVLVHCQLCFSNDCSVAD